MSENEPTMSENEPTFDVQLKGKYMAERRAGLNNQQKKIAADILEEKIGVYRAYLMGLQNADPGLRAQLQEAESCFRLIQTGLRVASGEVTLEEATKPFEVESAEIIEGEPERRWWQELLSRVKEKQGPVGGETTRRSQDISGMAGDIPK